MADLNELQATGTTKIIGSTNTGQETSPVRSTANGDLNTADILNNGGVQGSITIGTSAVAARVGGSNLANRKILIITNNSGNLINSDIFWGFTNAVTTATGTPLSRNAQIAIPAGPNTTIWLISASAGNNVRIIEGA